MSGPAVPVHCKCGWVGFRIPAKIKARPCPNCDGEVTRWRGLEAAAMQHKQIATDLVPTPLESTIAEKKADWDAPLKALPVPYYLRAATGEVQIFRIPAQCRRRAARRRRR